MFDPRTQWNPTLKLVDLHPRDWKRTKKVNPVLPAIEAMEPYYCAWAQSNSKPVKSRKRAWNTLRDALGLRPEMIAKTIRHSVATILRTRKAPGDEVETLLGHRVLKKSTAVFAKYDPDYLADARDALATLFDEVMAAAALWDAGHLRAKPRNKALVVLRRDSPEALEWLAEQDRAGA